MIIGHHQSWQWSDYTCGQLLFLYKTVYIYISISIYIYIHTYIYAHIDKSLFLHKTICIHNRSPSVLAAELL
jgi:hypothetical protein